MMRGCATAVQHVFHGGTACARETLPRSRSHHGQHGAALTKGERRHKGHVTHRQSRRAEGEGRGGGANFVGYAVRGRCGHRIAIIRSAGEDDDGARGCVLVVCVYGFRGKNEDNALAHKRRGGSVLHNQRSRPGIQTNNRDCVLGRGYHRRQRP